jgi:hypothetical protein
MLILRLLVIMGVSALGMSCASAVMVKRQMERTNVPYPHVNSKGNSPEVEIKDTVYVVSEMGPQKTDRGIDVKLLTGYFVPLLIYNEWGGQYDVMMPHSYVNGDRQEFVESQLFRQIRYGLHWHADTSQSIQPATDDLVLEVKVEEWGVRGTYSAKGSATYFLIVYLFRERHKFIGSAFCQLRYRLRKGDTVLVENTVKSSVDVLQPQGKFKSTQEVRGGYVTAFGDALFQVFNQSSYDMVNELAVFVRE